MPAALYNRGSGDWSVYYYYYCYCHSKTVWRPSAPADQILSQVLYINAFEIHCKQTTSRLYVDGKCFLKSPLRLTTKTQNRARHGHSSSVHDIFIKYKNKHVDQKLLNPWLSRHLLKCLTTVALCLKLLLHKPQQNCLTSDCIRWWTLNSIAV